MNIACIDIVFSLKIVTALPGIGLKKRMEWIYKGTLELQALTVCMHKHKDTRLLLIWSQLLLCVDRHLLPSKTFWLQECIPAPYQA